jgi:hypothetical protein
MRQRKNQRIPSAPAEASARASFITHPTKIDRASPPPSRKRLFATWSMTSRKSRLQAAGMPRRVIRIPIPQAARLRGQPSPSIVDDTTTSSSEIAEVSAPTTSEAKKSGPTTRPTVPMPANAWGRVMKRAPTVLSFTASDRPKAKIIGKTTRPAMKAMPTSAPAMTSDSLGRCWSRPR